MPLLLSHSSCCWFVSARGKLRVYRRTVNNELLPPSLSASELHVSHRLDSLSRWTECVKVNSRCIGICRSRPEMFFCLLTGNLKRKIVNEKVNFASIASLGRVFLTLSFCLIQEFSWTPVKLGAPFWTARPCAV